MEGGNPAEALADFEAALNMVLGSDEVMFELARAKFALGDHEAARGSITRAGATNPEDASLRETAGWAFHEMGCYPEASEAFQRAIELEPTAIETLATLVSRLPDLDAHEQLGWWQWEAGEITAAQDAFRHAIELDPAHASSAYVGLASLLLEVGKAAAPSSSMHRSRVRPKG